MRNFDYSFLRHGLLPARLVNRVAAIASLNALAGVRKQAYPQVFTELEALAKIQSVKSSNALEGIVTSDQRIAAIVRQNSAPLDHQEEEIAGYRDALNQIHLGYPQLDFNQRTILGLHRVLLSLTHHPYGGQYKREDNLILEVDADGRRQVRFRPTPAAETEAAMEQLELAYLAARADGSINQLLLIPCVILDFLCIHPFQDGNGRLSRLLTLLLLYKNGYDVGKYVSLEGQINTYKASYYEALRQSSAAWEEGRNSYLPFLENFLFLLHLCYRELDQRCHLVDGRRLTKKAQVEAAVLGSLVPLSKGELCQLLPAVSPTTVEAVLGELVKKGLIKRSGAGRASRYSPS